MNVSKMIKAMIFATAIFWHLGCMAQQKMDLATLHFTEDIRVIIKDISNLRSGKLGGTEDMVSYGFDNDGRFTFSGVVPGHIELLSWKGKLAGYAFQITSFPEQQKVEKLFQSKYKNASVQTSKFINVYHAEDDNVSAELRCVIEEKFKDGAKGYLDVKRADFNKAYKTLIKR